MSVNEHLPHVLVLSEDDANRQLAISFRLDLAWDRQRQMQVLRVAGGWGKVLSSFDANHAKRMDRCPNRFLVLLIDFDTDQPGYRK